MKLDRSKEARLYRILYRLHLYGKQQNDPNLILSTRFALEVMEGEFLHGIQSTVEELREQAVT